MKSLIILFGLFLTANASFNLYLNEFETMRLLGELKLIRYLNLKFVHYVLDFLTK